MPEALAARDYYRATSSPLTYPAYHGARECAVCIVGAGFAGLGTAMSLLERGQRDVVVLDAQTVGHGASGRNGGFVFGGFSLGERALQRAAGAAEARRLYGLTLAAVQTIQRRVQAHGIDCALRASGVYLANWFRDNRILREQQQFMADAFGVQWRFVGREELGSVLLTARYAGALFEPGGCHFHPLQYAQGLARVLAQAGVGVHEGSAAERIERRGAHWLVHTASGTVHARELLLCCGGYLGALDKRLARAMLPIATYVMTTEALGARLQEAIRTEAAVYDTRFAFDYYRPLADTRLLWGGRIAVGERTPAAVARLLYRDMLRVYPQLAGVRVEHAWSGLMSYGRHKMPQLGRLPDGRWYAMGFGGHGVAPTTAAGEVMAAALCGDAGPLRAFGRWQLPWTGGTAGMAAAQLSYWGYQLRDALRR